jgi:hypothetical protein
VREGNGLLVWQIAGGLTVCVVCVLWVCADVCVKSQHRHVK